MRDGAIVFASMTFINVLNYGIHFILSRGLGVDNYAAFGSMISALAIVGIPAAFMTLVVVKYVAEFHALEEGARIRILSQRMLLVGAGAGGACLLAAFVFRSEIAGFLRLGDPWDVPAAALTLMFGFLLPAMSGVLQGVQDFVALATSITVEGVGKIALAVVFMYAGWGVPGVFVGFALAGATSFAYTFILARRHWGFESARLAIDARRLIRTASAVMIGTSAMTVISFADVLLVKHFFDAPQAGMYLAASVCGKMLYFVGGFVPMLVLPKAAARAATGESPVPVLLLGVALTVAFAGLGLALFFIEPRLIVRLTYGSAFLPAAKYIFVYGLAMSLLALTNLVVTYKIALHRHDFVWPLLTSVALQAVGIALFHRTLWMVVDVMLFVGVFSLALSALHLPRYAPESKMHPEPVPLGEGVA